MSMQIDLNLRKLNEIKSFFSAVSFVKNLSKLIAENDRIKHFVVCNFMENSSKPNATTETGNLSLFNICRKTDSLPSKQLN